MGWAPLTVNMVFRYGTASIDGVGIVVDSVGVGVDGVGVGLNGVDVGSRVLGVEIGIWALTAWV